MCNSNAIFKSSFSFSLVYLFYLWNFGLGSIQLKKSKRCKICTKNITKSWMIFHFKIVNLPEKDRKTALIPMVQFRISFHLFSTSLPLFFSCCCWVFCFWFFYSCSFYYAFYSCKHTISSTQNRCHWLTQTHVKRSLHNYHTTLKFDIINRYDLRRKYTSFILHQ